LPAETVGRLLPDSDAHHLDVPALREFLGRVMRDGEAPASCEIEIELPLRGPRTLIVTARHIRRGETATKWILISLSDITDYRQNERQLAEARHAADEANLAKSRFLAAVSHDLRQPLQALTFQLDMGRRKVQDAETSELLARAGESAGNMSSMLNALLDIDRLETGSIHPELGDFPVGNLLDRLAAEFGDLAAVHGLEWRYVRCRLGVRSDTRLLEQMLRNLLSNALHYTAQGKVLLGCRRRGDRISVEVWDTGIGIAEQDLSVIFEEYRRGGTHEEGGVGLGLAIVKRLGELLGHTVSVRSQLGKGSVFAIEVPVSPITLPRTGPGAAPMPEAGRAQGGAILVIDDDPTLRQALQSLLAGYGYRTAAAASGDAALALVTGNGFRPDAIVSDFLLPGRMNGARTAEALRGALGREVPVIFLTGDTRSVSSQDLALANSTRFAKPVKSEELLRAVQHYLTARPAATPAQDAHAPAAETEAVATVFLVDDDRDVREAMRDVLAKAGYRAEAFATGEACLNAKPDESKSCFIIDVRLPGISGLELLARLAASGNASPAILITGHGDISTAVRAMRAGAFDFLEKPVQTQELLAVVDRALQQAAIPAERESRRAAAVLRLATLTSREREVMDHVINGRANKEVAARLAISQRTVETHRASVMKKMGATSISDLVRLVLAGEAVAH